MTFSLCHVTPSGLCFIIYCYSTQNGKPAFCMASHFALCLCGSLFPLCLRTLCSPIADSYRMDSVSLLSSSLTRKFCRSLRSVSAVRCFRSVFALCARQSRTAIAWTALAFSLRPFGPRQKDYCLSIRALREHIDDACFGKVVTAFFKQGEISC